MAKNIVFVLIVFLSNIIQCITGFAGTVLCMPFSIMLVGYTTAKPILNVLGALASLGVVAFNFRHINKKVFIKITLVMIVGILGANFINSDITQHEEILYKALGIIVIGFAVFNTCKFYCGKESRNNRIIHTLILFCAGIVHGLFVCGGPLLVTYACSQMKDKDEFRATISACWVILNGIIFFEDISFGYFSKNVVFLLLICVLVLILSLLIGNKIAKKMSRDKFLKLTYILMAISGFSLLIK